MLANFSQIFNLKALIYHNFLGGILPDPLEKQIQFTHIANYKCMSFTHCIAVYIATSLEFAPAERMHVNGTYISVAAAWMAPISQISTYASE